MIKMKAGLAKGRSECYRRGRAGSGTGRGHRGGRIFPGEGQSLKEGEHITYNRGEVKAGGGGGRVGTGGRQDISC